MVEKITALWGLASFALGLAVKSVRNGGSKPPPYGWGDAVGVTMRADTIRPYGMGQIDFMQWSYGRDVR